MPAKHLDTTVYRAADGTDTWIVEAIDIADEGIRYVDAFTGSGAGGNTARARAIAFAESWYRSVTVTTSRRQRQRATVETPALRAIMAKIRGEIGG
jgi:hypothetical protein